MTTATLNVTYQGESRDVAQLDYTTADEDVLRIAAESMNLQVNVFVNFVVDRFDTEQGGQRLYVRPKVPFGADFLKFGATEKPGKTGTFLSSINIEPYEVKTNGWIF